MFGDDNIKVDKAGGSERGETIQPHVDSGSPIVGDVGGTSNSVCGLSHLVWGRSLAGKALTHNGARQDPQDP